MSPQAKINYHKLMKEEIQQIQAEFSQKARKPSLLLHSCCGPCSTVCLERLEPFFDISVFFYNPNIDPPEEFNMRLEAQKKYLALNPQMKDVKLIIPENQRQDFIDAINLSQFPERRREAECLTRCSECYRFRLQKTALYAQKNNFDFWTTTLTLGPQKDAQKINAIADQIQKITEGSRLLHADFKKEGGYLRSIELCKKYEIYRQKYCGCIFGREVQYKMENKDE
ncbi:MAG: epoxyqueuosine reductase QueH [Treponemataceae bacterium]|nr:epoxyqueuosine reductase QueH [Treponemataceae bacterium]